MGKKLTVSTKAVTIRKPRGAPKKTFVRDPDRYAINRADAYMTLGTSENDAFGAVSAQMLGEMVAEQDVASRRKRGRGLMPAGTLVTYARKAGGGTTASFAGKATTLRLKAKAADRDPEAVAWRTAMCRAYVLALTATKDHGRCVAIISELAALVGEQAYARAVLLPLLEARFFWSGHLSTNVSPNELV